MYVLVNCLWLLDASTALLMLLLLFAALLLLVYGGAALLEFASRYSTETIFEKEKNGKKRKSDSKVTNV